MRRLVVVAAGMAGLAALPLSHWLMAAPVAKVSICHIDPDETIRPHVIVVSESSVPAHLAHGDCETTLAPGADCSCGT
jgi:hypothetical protein